MTILSEPDKDQSASILCVVDGIATLGIGSSGTTSPRDLRVRVSVVTNSELFKRPERPIKLNHQR